MAKAPISGAVKSRLVPPLTEDEAAALSRCFISDVCASIEAASAILAADGHAGVVGMIAHTPAGAPAPAIVAADRNARVVGLIAYTPAGEQAAFDGLVPASFKFIAQRGDGLTARLTNVAADLLATGYESVSLMNSDSPTIPPAFIAQAITHLASAGDDRLAQTKDHLAQAGDHLALAGDRLAIIGADDGGYCLIGLKRPHWRLFEEIAWSTGAVLAQTLQRAAELRLVVLQTPSWYDVDDAGSLRRLIGDLFGNLSGASSGGPRPREKSPGNPPASYPPPQEALNQQMSKNPPGIHPPGPNATSEKSLINPPTCENRRIHNKANFFTAPATRGWLSEALANGLAARLLLAPSADSAGQPPRDRRSPDG
jgi:glycosyltransferase A (GT-A) superfamily protein (DUF2064 family)